MKKTDQTVRDLLYLDFDKAASIWSQFEEGLVERTDVTDETGKDRAVPEFDSIWHHSRESAQQCNRCHANRGKNHHFYSEDNQKLLRSVSVPLGIETRELKCRSRILELFEQSAGCARKTVSTPLPSMMVPTSSTCS